MIKKPFYEKLGFKRQPTWIVGIILLLAFLVTVGIISDFDKYNKMFIEVSLGLLAFVAIFYSFVLKKEVADKRINLLTSEWEKRFPKIEGVIDSIRTEIGNKTKDYGKMLAYSHNLTDELENMTLFEKEIDMGDHLFWGIATLMSSLVLFFLDSLLGAPINLVNSTLPLRSVGYALLLCGIYKAFALLFLWDRIIRS